MRTTSERPGRHVLRPALRALVPLLVGAFLLAGTVDAFAISRATVLSRAQSWIDVPVKYSQSKYFEAVKGDGKYRTDCSGFTSMAWRLTADGRPESRTTRSLKYRSAKINWTTIRPGDAMIKYNYHARIFYGWVDETHTDYVCYEQTGPSSKSSIKSMPADIAYGYRPYRYEHISEPLPAWNLAVNPTFDVWVSTWSGPPRGTVMWWEPFGAQGASVCTRTTNVTKTGRSSLGLLNPYARSRDVVGVAQTTGVTPGKPYTLSAWASTPADATGLSMRLEFVNSSGTVIKTASTSAAGWQIGAASLGRMSVTGTAPAEATSATISLRLAGGVDASGTAGTRATIDDVSFWDCSPASMTFAISKTTVVRGETTVLSGTVSAPVAVGTVRVYVTRPGATKPVTVDRPLVNGSWTLTYKPGYRGTYSYVAKYLGYGPYGTITSAPVRLRVK